MKTITHVDGTVWLGDAYDGNGLLLTTKGIYNYDLRYINVDLEGNEIPVFPRLVG